jgi:anti-sigma regulatory factor (Ser/Thr protein kinase)
MEEDFKPNIIKLAIPSDPKWLKTVRANTAEISQRMKFSRLQVRGMVLAVDEACANVIRYAYRGDKQKEIIIYFKVFDDRLEILIKDFGEKGRPGAFKSRDLKEIRPGGLGIHFIRKVMDEVRYDISPPEGTELYLVKYKKRRKGYE